MVASLFYEGFVICETRKKKDTNNIDVSENNISTTKRNQNKNAIPGLSSL